MNVWKRCSYITTPMSLSSVRIGKYLNMHNDFNNELKLSYLCHWLIACLLMSEQWRRNAGKMPVYSIPVTLAEVLEVNGTALNDSELWALLYAASKSLLDLLLRGHISICCCVQTFQSLNWLLCWLLLTVGLFLLVNLNKLLVSLQFC